MMFLYVSLAACLAGLLLVARTLRRRSTLAVALPGPPPLPLLGNGLLFVATSREFVDVLIDLTRQYGEHVRFYLGPELNVVVTDPHDIRLLLTSNKLNQKGPLYKNLEDVIGPGILTGGPTWRGHRKVVTAAYNKRAVQHFGGVFRREAGLLLRDLSRREPGRTFDIFRDVVRTTTQCVCQTLMGLTKEESLRVRRMDEVVTLTDDFYILLYSKMTKWWYWSRPLFKLLGGQRKQDKFKQMSYEMTKDIVRMRSEALQARGATAKDLQGDEVFGIVDRYILCGELTDQEIVEETLSLFTTSQEASAKITCCVLLFLAHMPEWQEKVYEEIIEVVGTEERPISDEDFKRLHNLNLVYKEALRYQPIAACIQRTVMEDIALETADVTLPAGTSVVVPLHALHRDPRHWVQPDRVRPERFLPEEAGRRDPNAFVPFSLGAMDCLGRVYATALIKTLVVRVVREYQLSAEGRLEEFELEVAISAKVKAGYNMRLRTRRAPA